MYASGKPWSHDDLCLLCAMVRDRMDIRAIRRALRRSEKAVMHAMKNVVYQQLLHHDAAELAEFYRIHPGSLESRVVPSKYYVSLEDVMACSNDPSDDLEGSFPVFWGAMMAVVMCVMAASVCHFVRVLTGGGACVVA